MLESEVKLRHSEKKETKSPQHETLEIRRATEISTSMSRVDLEFPVQLPWFRFLND